MKKVIIAFLMIIFLFLPGCSDAYKESQYSKVLNEYVYSEYLIGFNETGTAKKFKKNLLYSDNNVFEISKTNKVTNNICAYVDSDVLASLYEVKSIFEEVDNDSSIFYTDSLLRAYQIAQSKIIENIRPEFYINKNEYPIHWYDVKNNKKIKSEFDNMVLIGVIECENYKFNSLGNNKSFNTIVLQETYEYFTNFKTKDINIRDKKNNVLSSLLFNYTDSGKEFIFEKNFDLILYLNSFDIIDIEQEKYINIGDDTTIYKYSLEEYSEKLDDYNEGIITYDEFIEFENSCQDLTNRFNYKKKIIDNRIAYLFKYDDIKKLL